jgi:hypothetical protein
MINLFFCNLFYIKIGNNFVLIKTYPLRVYEIVSTSWMDLNQNIYSFIINIDYDFIVTEMFFFERNLVYIAIKFVFS